MRDSAILLFAVAVLVTACTTVPKDPTDTLLVAPRTTAPPEPTDALLVEADAKLIARDFNGALISYTAFVTATPRHPQAARARAMQTALERMISFEHELSRAQRTNELARRESSDRQAETERLKSEVTKLRADLERLRIIDLQPIRPEAKK